MAEERPSQPGAPRQQIKLGSLAPEFENGQHGIYVRHLEEAVLDKRNRNIALTGRYGAGKSSVLDDFQKKHDKDTVRISINTLGPDKDDEDLTNRIQKELVKQLVYRLTPGKIRRSRFARPKPVTKGRAFLHALFISVVGLGFPWVLGVRSGPGWPDAAADLPGYLVRAGMLFILVLVSLWAARWIIGDRIVSEVTTAGTKIALGEGPTTYFDSFLDEIVAFFDTVKPKFVIFEDLDRFEDPQIFDSLRELNTLINSSANWQPSDAPLRFIYAIKDSLFEQLGKEPELKDGEAKATDGPDGTTASAKPRLDIAAEAVRRANRTKFFEIVVPMVPFISHRNARDLLAEELVKLGLDENDVSRPLLDLIARHTTDMRLMKNICNEFVVFAEHLLWTKTPAPGMTADHLFALVAYKNFHLADFEAISQRASTLDELERIHRDEVRTLIEGLQEQRRNRMRTEEQRERKEETAAKLGSRLREIKDFFPPTSGHPYVSVTVDDEGYGFDAAGSVEFWERVAKSKTFSIVQRYNSTPVTPSREQISRVFPEVINSTEWLDPDPEELARLIDRYDRDIATLRGADFAGLASYERLPKGRIGFDQRITDVLDSELARDLVRRGFITRNYAEYSAIFYGKFVGVDVAFFYNHSIQPNEMYVDYEFKSEKAMSNLLEQVPADFTSSVSALNLQVASHLLKEKPEDAKQLVAYVVTHDGKDVQKFLDAFLNAPDAPRELLVQKLTEHPWRDVFEYLAGHPGIPDEETRLKLFDRALLTGLHADVYEIGESSRALLESSYPRLTAVRESQTATQTERVFEFLEAVELVVTDLGELNAPLRVRIVAAHRYKVSAPNLQLALGVDVAPTLDEVRKIQSVWEFCKTRIDDYVAAMEADGSAQPIVLMESVLVDVINEQHGSWTEDQLRDVIERSAASATIQEIEDVPEPTWPLIVDAGLMAPTVANIFAYALAHGVDERLAGLLVPDGADQVELQDFEEVADPDRGVLAVRLLNASAHLAAQARVQLVKQLNLESAIELAKVTPGPDQLLARALEAKLLPDTFDTFAHFATCGWESVSEAFAVSKNASGFMTPALLAGFVGEFVESPWIPDELRRMVVERLGDYVPGDDKKALRAAGQFAIGNQIWLSLGEIRRIARVTQDPDIVLRQLTYARDTAPADLSGILASLGQPYDGLSAGPGSEFDLPAGSSNETLFKRLEAAGRIEIVQKIIGRGRKVRNLV
ncbi:MULTISPECIES: hypothetical protein [Arthrobacter]|uniref:YobI-like P-loop NTPase domain-containing protein n=1 Tax=Arthrobacter terricola TaxID=2547396 RepID=A0A4R5K836_9MICC|nr:MULTISPECIES: hypothetical protein [Arthrobacter]MBT8163158.1 hypothetical protein [Arthrobacter sp. GN70]TDF91271.1 hypothetical protein E1809_21155 [Arthrobacter terricola]